MFAITLISLPQSTLQALITSGNHQDYLERVLQPRPYNHSPHTPEKNDLLELDKFGYTMLSVVLDDEKTAVPRALITFDNGGHVTALKAADVRRVAQVLHHIDPLTIAGGTDDPSVVDVFEELVEFYDLASCNNRAIIIHIG